MPYDILERDNQFCIVSGDEVVTCHDTREDALTHMTALYANVEDARSLRMYQGGAIKAVGNNRLAGYLIRFTDATKRDLYGEYFSTATDLAMDKGYAIKGSPVMFNHGFDSKIGIKRVGTIQDVKVSDEGVWVEALIEEQDEYMKEVLEAIQSGRLGAGWSSGALPQSVRVDDSGHIRQWAVIEASITHTPAMPVETRIMSAKAFQAYLDNKKEEPVVNMNDEMKNAIREMAMGFADEILKQLGADMPADELAEEMTEAIIEEAKSEDMPEDVAKMDEEEMEKSLRKHFEARLVNVGLTIAQQRKESGISNAVRNAINAEGQPKTRGGFDGHANKNIAFIGRAEAPSLAGYVKARLGYGDSSAYRAQNPEIGPLGGFLIGQELSTQILDPLRPKVVMFNAGVRQTTVNNIGVYTIPKMTSAPTAYRPGINEPISDSNAQFDQVSAVLRPIAGKSIIPLQLLMHSPMEAQSKIQEQLVMSLNLGIDQEILIGTGSVEQQNTGKGILGVERAVALSSAASTNIVTLAANGAPVTFDNLIDADTRLDINNVQDTGNRAWVMAPRDKGNIRKIKDAVGQPLLFENYSQAPYAELLGRRAFTTTQLPTNLTTGTNANTSWLFYGDWAYSEYVMSNTIEVIVDQVTLADKLQVRIIAYTYSDFIVHYPEAFYVMKGVANA